MRLRLLFLCTLAAGCTCNKSGGLTEKPPDDLPSQGLVIDQPAEGATLKGAWTTVSGWASPDWVQGVLVLGAPVAGSYEPTGHVGAPTVPVTFRADGRFYAPRVPLQDGQVKLTLIGIGKGGSTYQPATRTVTASDTSVIPATLVVDPAQPRPGQKATLRATTGENLSTSFQWDFEGDGTFDAEGASVTHSWDTAGTYLVIARTRVDNVWVSATARVAVSSAPAVVAATTVANPRGIFVLSGNPEATLEDGGTPRHDDLVAVLDGDDVRVFDTQLQPRFVLSGLSHPGDVMTDETGRIYVADTGHDRFVRFTADGQPDPTYGQGGGYRGTAALTLTRPSSFWMLDDGTFLNCWVTIDQPTCSRLDRAEYDERLAGLGLHFARLRPPWILTTEGRLLKMNEGNGIPVMRTKEKVVDAVAGPTFFRADFATVDADGAIHVYRAGEHESKWTLPYAATTIAGDAQGRLYVGAPGVVELRAFKLE